MFGPLKFILGRTIKTGHLRLVDAEGQTHVFGDGTGSPVLARIQDKRTERRLFFNASLAIGEAYMDRRLVLEQGTIYDLLEVLLINTSWQRRPGWIQALDDIRSVALRLQHYNLTGRSRRNVAHHYDIDGSLYDLFLDSDRQYSCAYFEEDGQTLEEAQEAKKRHIAAKLNLSDGMRVLDIGSGWGGLALHLAKTAHVDVTGITLSEAQLKTARDRAAAEGLSKAVRFELCDYRNLEGQFDRIVSVGMFEHVGTAHYRHFFRQLDRLLADRGVALLHSIGQFDAPTPTNPFIAKYIFPGGYVPALSEVLPALEREGLLTTDLEILRLHYAMTLRHWRQRFRAAWHTASERFGERFCRMWEMYLASSEAAFRYQKLMVFQLQLAKDIDALPVTRDYITDRERDLRARAHRTRPTRSQGST
ncbi:cyclopropane-fatty-acyl-phospholipid synthase [Methyloceanibacter methanicus]|uniref:Cyclopropane-fatty-acyl-phospholipid synthase n=1 Tax=Methyloceanibacter methanicus TaxID=1774968 RepID=A0A1E3W556_9HYPH|nr:cyclopropane-fatty-acyl-phospholipid synthase family protein [Methyloceanibacter methanicus]ODS00958.1 cyclopropane-fatty-acyl-phospholipid synthase [Methyloceanibacter methanicus]